MRAHMLVLMAAMIPLTACAGMPASQKSDAERAARFEAAAGQPVNHIFLRSRGFYAWTPLNDHQIAAYVTPKEAYLLDLPSCPGLEHTPGIAITSRMQQVSINFDTVTSTRVGVPCHIRQIRPLDLNVIKGGPPHHGDVQVMSRPAKAKASSGDDA